MFVALPKQRSLWHGPFRWSVTVTQCFVMWCDVLEEYRDIYPGYAHLSPALFFMGGLCINSTYFGLSMINALFSSLEVLPLNGPISSVICSVRVPVWCHASHVPHACLKLFGPPKLMSESFGLRSLRTLSSSYLIPKLFDPKFACTGLHVDDLRKGAIILEQGNDCLRTTMMWGYILTQ